MKTNFGQLTYCTNIHPGESWEEHFSILQDCLPTIKADSCPNEKMGLGLRLSNEASIDLLEHSKLEHFKNWLNANDFYVFTMNGFPFGAFHNEVVKDNVHKPDWTTTERTDYTIRLFDQLATLLPEELQEGGISTSPLSYRHWWTTPDSLQLAVEKSTKNILIVLDHLIKIHHATGKILHLDIEPEPDGIIENSEEFINWYLDVLIPMGINHLKNNGHEEQEAVASVKRHIQLCYDVCHFAIGFESITTVIQKLETENIKVGKIQISAALEVDFLNNPQEKLKAISQYNEPTYLHQVVAKTKNNQLLKYKDLDNAIAAFDDDIALWRVHFHVPLFLENYGVLRSTQAQIKEVIDYCKQKNICNHLEIETYTWNILPKEYQLPLINSIIREINWVKNLL